MSQPVRLDVQGIAPIDRLGELTWLGPLSVLVFGLMVGLVVRAASVPRFDLWMLLLTVGTFVGAYPLMYFAQEYIALGPAVLISAGFALTVIGVLAVTLMGVWLALGGVLLPATVIAPAPRGGHALRSFGAWHRQASLMSGSSSRTVIVVRFTRTAGNPL